MKESKKTIELVLAIQNGDQQAITTLYHWYRQRLINKAKKKFPQIAHTAIEDAFHDALWVVIEKYIKTKKIKVDNGELKGLKKDSLEALLFFIMKCNLIKHHNWKKNYPSMSPDEYLNRYDTEIDIKEMRGADDESTNLVMKAFKMLRPLCQEIISGKLLNGNSFRDLSEELGSTEGVLRVQSHRCIKQLKVIYEKLCKTT